jgi:leucyl aminopeptidase
MGGCDLLSVGDHLGRTQTVAATLDAVGRMGSGDSFVVHASGRSGDPGWEPERVAAWAESGARIGRMNRRYRSGPAGWARLAGFNFGPHCEPESSHFLSFRMVESEALFAKHLIDRPRTSLGPSKFESMLRSRARALNVDCESIPLGRDQGVATSRVGQAASESPRILKLTYLGAPDSESNHACFCGKGITMDTGGLGLKGQAGMRVMKTDMAGAAVASGAVFAAARLGLSVNLTALVAIAENAIGSRAMAPGDLIRYPGGTTVEVTDTDSEGRLVLADLCLLAAGQGAERILTIGTLTEVVSWTIGRSRAGLQTRSESLVKGLTDAGSRSGESIWHLPIPEEHGALMDGGWVDLVNSSGPPYGGIQPALFLERFVQGVEWGHLEITGPSFMSEWGGASATGFGVGLLVEFARSLCAQGE